MIVEHGDCLDVMPRLAAAGLRVDAIVTDPPYGLSFMGKHWDRCVPGARYWKIAGGLLRPGGHLVAFAGTRTYHRIACAIEDAGFEVRDMVAWLYGGGYPKSTSSLKPALEPIVLARKPLSAKSIAANVLKHGTGSINADGCRIAGAVPNTVQGQSGNAGTIYGADQRTQRAFRPHAGGRWPANVVHDGSDDVLEAFAPYGERTSGTVMTCHGDTGSVARFFYAAKADATDRLGSKHPTVKPVDLMRWLVRLVTPPGGTVLDPFAGTGTTGMACMAEGLKAILIEREAEYVADIKRRIGHVAGADTPLFAEGPT